jgi:hypothetical protein
LSLQDTDIVRTHIPLCKWDKCLNSPYARELCKQHYKYSMYHKLILPLQERPSNYIKGTKCLVIECNKQHRINGEQLVKGYCKNHYKNIIAKDNDKNRYTRLRNTLINALGGKCIYCGIKDRRCLQFDHINGHGRQQLGKQFGVTSGNSVYLYYINNIEEFKSTYQLLCANCNIIKKIENHEDANIKYTRGINI